MNAEHLRCTQCGRKTTQAELHVSTSDGRCLAAEVTWWTAPTGAFPTVRKVGEFPPRPGSVPGPEKGL